MYHSAGEIRADQYYGGWTRQASHNDPPSYADRSEKRFGYQSRYQQHAQSQTPAYTARYYNQASTLRPQVTNHKYGMSQAPSLLALDMQNNHQQQHGLHFHHDERLTRQRQQWILQASDLYESPEHIHPLPHQQTSADVVDIELDLSFNSSSGSSSKSSARRQPAMGRHAKTYQNQHLYTKSKEDSLNQHDSPETGGRWPFSDVGLQDPCIVPHLYPSNSTPPYQNRLHIDQNKDPIEDDFLRDETSHDWVRSDQDINLNSSYPLLKQRSHINFHVRGSRVGLYTAFGESVTSGVHRHSHHDKTPNYSHRHSMSDGHLAQQGLCTAELQRYPHLAVKGNPPSRNESPLQFRTPTVTSFSSSGYESSHIGEHVGPRLTQQNSQSGSSTYRSTAEEASIPAATNRNLEKNGIQTQGSGAISKKTRRPRNERRKTIASTAVNEIRSMTGEEHSDFRSQLRYLLGLSKPATGQEFQKNAKKDTTLTFRSPHKPSDEMLHKRLQRVLDNPSSSYLRRNKMQSKRERTKSMPIDITAFFSALHSTPRPLIQRTPFQLVRSESEMGIHELDLSADTVMTSQEVRNSMTSSYEELNQCFSMNISILSESVASPSHLSSRESDSVREGIDSPISEIFIDKEDLVEYQLGLRADLPCSEMSDDFLSDDNTTQSSTVQHISTHRYCRNVTDYKQCTEVNTPTTSNLSQSSQSSYSSGWVDSSVNHSNSCCSNDCMQCTEKAQYKEEIKGFSAHRKNYRQNFNAATLNSDTRCNHIALRSLGEGLISCTNPCTICKHYTARGILQTVTDRCTCGPPVACINNNTAVAAAADKKKAIVPDLSVEVDKNTCRIKSDLELNDKYSSDLSQRNHSSDYTEDYGSSYTGTLDCSLSTTTSVSDYYPISHKSVSEGSVKAGQTSHLNIEQQDAARKHQPHLRSLSPGLYHTCADEVAYRLDKGLYYLKESTNSGREHKSRRSLFEDSQRERMEAAASISAGGARPAALRLSAYGFVISEKSSPLNKPSAVVRPVGYQQDYETPAEPTYKEMSLSKNMISPMDSLASSSPGKGLGYFLQFDTPKSSQSRSRSRKRTAEKQKAARKTQSTPRKMPAIEKETQSDKKNNKSTNPVLLKRAGSSSPTRRRSSSLAESLSRFKELQQLRQKLDTPTDDVFDSDENSIAYNTPATQKCEDRPATLDSSFSDISSTTELTSVMTEPSQVVVPTVTTDQGTCGGEITPIIYEQWAAPIHNTAIPAESTGSKTKTDYNTETGHIDMNVPSEDVPEAKSTILAEKYPVQSPSEFDSLPISTFSESDSDTSHGNPATPCHIISTDHNDNVNLPDLYPSNTENKIISKEHTTPRIQAEPLRFNLEDTIVDSDRDLDTQSDISDTGHPICTSIEQARSPLSSTETKFTPFAHHDEDDIVPCAVTLEYSQNEGHLPKYSRDNDTGSQLVTDISISPEEPPPVTAHYVDNHAELVSECDNTMKICSEVETESDACTGPDSSHHNSAMDIHETTNRTEDGACSPLLILNNETTSKDSYNSRPFQLHIHNDLAQDSPVSPNLSLLRQGQYASSVELFADGSSIDTDSCCTSPVHYGKGQVEDNSNVKLAEFNAMKRCSADEESVLSRNVGDFDLELEPNEKHSEIRYTPDYSEIRYTPDYFRESTPSQDEMEMMVKKNILHLNQQELDSVNVSLQLSNTDTSATHQTTNMDPQLTNGAVVTQKAAVETSADMNSNHDSFTAPVKDAILENYQEPLDELQSRSTSVVSHQDDVRSSSSSEVETDTAAGRPSYHDIFQRLSSQTELLDTEPTATEHLNALLHNVTPHCPDDKSQTQSISPASSQLAEAEVGVRSPHIAVPNQTDGSQLSQLGDDLHQGIVISAVISATHTEAAEELRWQKDEARPGSEESSGVKKTYVDRTDQLEYHLGGHTVQQDCWLPSSRKQEANLEVSADAMESGKGSLRSNSSSSRKSWIKQLSQRYETLEDDVVEVPQRKSVLRGSVSTEHTDDQSSHSTSSPGQSSHSTSPESQIADSHPASKGDGDQYSVEILGGEEPPDEWMSLSERKTSLSLESVDLQSQAESELTNKDIWRLSERDDDTLEVDMRKEAGELNDQDVSLASDEESMMQTPAQSQNGSFRVADTSGEYNTAAKRISAPTSFPSNFSSIRSGRATERFEERMKTIEKMKSLKAKSKFAPVVATVGKFSSAFRRFEAKEDRSHSADGKLSTLKARHSSVSASLSISTDKKHGTNASPISPPAAKKLPRSPYHGSLPRDLNKANGLRDNVDGSATKHSTDESARGRRQGRHSPESARRQQSAPAKNRSVKLPVESSRMIRSVRDSTNAPDVVPTALQERRTEDNPDEEPTQQFDLTTEAPTSMTFEAPRSGGNRIPHYDIDIVIKREPLPDDVDPENYRELPTAAITLGRDEVKVMKIESLTQRMMSPTEVITVWDTEVPVKDSTEKVIPPQKLHVTHLNRAIVGVSPTMSNTDSLRGMISPPLIKATQPAPGTFIKTPVVLRSKPESTEKQQPLTIQPQSVSVRPQNITDDRQRSQSQDDLLSPRMRSSLAFQPEAPVKVPHKQPSPPTAQNRLSSYDRAIPSRKAAPQAIEDSCDFSRASVQQSRPERAEYQQPVERVPASTSTNRLRSTVRPAGLVKSESLEELRSRGGLVADVKGAFNQDREPGKQYFGERGSETLRHTARAQQRTTLASEDLDYTRRWVEDAKKNSPPPQSNQHVTSPVRADPSTEDTKPWYMQRDSSPLKPAAPSTNNPIRGREGPRGRRMRAAGPRSKSVGRAPSKAIAQMAQFFQQEAELSEIGRTSSPIEFQGRALTPEVERDEIQRTQCRPQENSRSAPVNRKQPKERSHCPEPEYEERAIDCQPVRAGRSQSEKYRARPARTVTPPPKNERDMPEHDDNERPHSPMAPADGIDKFINLYNKKDVNSRFSQPAVQRVEPRDRDYEEIMVDEVRSPRGRPQMSQRQQSERIPYSRRQEYTPRSNSRDEEREVERAASFQSDRDEGDVDDRPLAASAFKAWLGSPERTKLEEKVESAYQRHVIKEKPHSRSKSESEGKRTKGVPWWKQQNEMATRNGEHKPEPPKPSPRRQMSPRVQHAPARSPCRSRSPEPFQQLQVVHDRPSYQPYRSEQNSQASLSPHRGQRDNDSDRQVPSNSSHGASVELIEPDYVSHPYHQPQIKVQPSGVEYSPYANYQIPSSDEPQYSQQQKAPVEDYYAQIRKRPAERTQSADLLVEAPPKPERSSMNYSDEKLNYPHQDNLQFQREYVEPVIKTRVDNQTYYDPYTTIEPEPAVMTPPQHQHYPPPHSEQPNRYSIEQRPDQYYSYRSQDPATERYHPSDPVYTDRQYPVHSYPQDRNYRPEEHYPSANQINPRQPHIEPRMTQRPYHTLDHRYTRQSRATIPHHAPEPASRTNSRNWGSATVDRRTVDPRDFNQRYHVEPVVRQDMRYQDHSDPRNHSLRHKPRQSYPSHHAHPNQTRGNQRPDLVPADPRQQRARSVPNSRPSHKSRDADQREKHSSLRRNDHERGEKNDKHDRKSKDKPSKSKNSKNKENKHKQQQNIGSLLPDFIPIHHVSEQAFNQRTDHMYQQRYEPSYGRPARQEHHHHHQASYNSRNRQVHSTYIPYPDRPRPGVGVMFNPDIGTTDF